jgi:hypothetical protein
MMVWRSERWGKVPILDARRFWTNDIYNSP